MESDGELDEFAFKFIRGCFVKNKNEISASQYTFDLSREVELVLKVATLPYDEAEEVTSPSTPTRVAILHKQFSSTTVNFFNFTSHMNDKGEYQFKGLCPRGAIFLIPIYEHYAWKDKDLGVYSVDVLERDGQELHLTEKAEQAVEDLFHYLDVDYNLKLSQEELSLFKNILGYKNPVSDEEWECIVLGWAEDTLEPAKIQISVDWFKYLMVRLADSEVIFNSQDAGSDVIEMFINIEDLRPYDKSKAILEYIFTRCGFDSNLILRRLNGFEIMIATEYPVVSRFQILPTDKVHVEDVLYALTVVMGKKKTIKDLSLKLYFYEDLNWYSLAVKNELSEPVYLLFNFANSRNILASTKYGFLKQFLLGAKSKQFVIRFIKASSSSFIKMHLKYASQSHQTVFRIDS